MEIFGLEKVKDQLAVFDSIPYQEQSAIFVKMVMNMDSSKQEMLKMMELYNKKDINQLNQLIAADNDLQQYENVLLNNRNQNWIPIIATAAKKQAANKRNATS